MSQDNLVKLACATCQKVTYHTRKNKKTIKARLELNKYCRFCKAKKLQKETK